MGKNAINKAFTSIKNLLVYQSSDQPDLFVLAETKADKKNATAKIPPAAQADAREFDSMLRYAKRLAIFMEKSIEVLRNGQLSDRPQN